MVKPRQGWKRGIQRGFRENDTIAGDVSPPPHHSRLIRRLSFIDPPPLQVIASRKNPATPRHRYKGGLRQYRAAGVGCPWRSSSNRGAARKNWFLQPPLNGRSGRKIEYGALYLRITRLILSLHGLLGFLRPLFCSVAGYLLEVVAESTVCVQDRLIICG